MKKLRNNDISAFLELVRAGLWESEVRLLPFEGVDLAQVHRLAEEQSVIGLVADGLEYVKDVKVSQDVVLPFVGATLQLECRNMAMNVFMAKLMGQLRDAGVDALLVKGQGIAQCYQRPLWRTPGDIDLLLSAEDYECAKKVLIPLANVVEQEITSLKHMGVMLGGFLVEMHGTLRTRLSSRVDRLVDSVQENVLLNGDVRVWHNGDTDVYIPAPDNDVIFLFTHILYHFYVEGIGLRQICDWCRFLWTYRDTLDRGLLKRRIQAMGLMSEWRAFAAMTVDWLGMPADAMPLYCGSVRWSRKGDMIIAFVLDCGNFGRNRKNGTASWGSYVGRKTRSLWRKIRVFGRHLGVFPVDSLRFFWHVFWDGISMVLRGE